LCQGFGEGRGPFTGDREVEVARREAEERVAHGASDDDERDPGGSGGLPRELDGAAACEAPERLARLGEGVHGRAGR
jgi:hypothetical protein